MTATTATCECGHIETIDPDGEYKVVPTGYSRWRRDPATSEVWLEDEMVYICNLCWEQLPEGDDE